ncbi:MAG: MBL fold metallo-hydrolase [Myxococcales bacterium]|jgi:glyoxylase-like metal-dependent hydrolase (beta-lactamase superfamily II)
METRVELFTSGIWQMSSLVVLKGGAGVVVDAGYFPRELEALSTFLAGRARVEALAFTHAHWDHVLGPFAFPDAPVLCSAVLARWVAADAEPARVCLEEAARYDSQWYVQRPTPYRWPSQLRGLADGERLTLGGIALQAHLLPGHTADGLALVVEEARALLVGDHLSPCEIPFIDDAAAYCATLRRLLGLLGAGIEEVFPGHGPRLTREQARRIAVEDLRYVEALLDFAAREDASGALALPLPRAQEVFGMREHHLENCAKVGLAVAK